MAVNLLGLPSQASGAARTATTVFLAAHVLITLGLLAGAVMIVRASARSQAPSRQLAVGGAIAIVATTAAGILTMITKSNWWYTPWRSASSRRCSSTAASSSRPELHRSNPGDSPRTGSLNSHGGLTG